jgi:hypothetical protein
MDARVVAPQGFNSQHTSSNPQPRASFYHGGCDPCYCLEQPSVGDSKAAAVAAAMAQLTPEPENSSVQSCNIHVSRHIKLP